jgi:hypothetical protein
LIGGWSSTNQYDTEIVSQIAEMQYAEIERNLLTISAHDDAPIIKIGNIWKAKSPLELMSVTGRHITQHELDRYLEQIKNILSAPDPQLELDKNERYAAQIYGKVRQNSSVIIESMCNSLIKLAVRGEILALSHLNLEYKIPALVKELIFNADTNRWLHLQKPAHQYF